SSLIASQLDRGVFGLVGDQTIYLHLAGWDRVHPESGELCGLQICAVDLDRARPPAASPRLSCSNVGRRPLCTCSTAGIVTQLVAHPSPGAVGSTPSVCRR